MANADMKRKRYIEEQIISILKAHEAGGTVPDRSRRHGVATNTIYRWKSRYSSIFDTHKDNLTEFFSNEIRQFN